MALPPGRRARVHHQGRPGTGIREQVSAFTTYFPYAEYRNINIGRAAEIIDGTIVQARRDILAQRHRRRADRGERLHQGLHHQQRHLQGGARRRRLADGDDHVQRGVLRRHDDVEHKPHSFYIDRYPVGREATVAWATVDLQFRNDTPYGVLIDAHVTPSTPSVQGVVTVRMFSTKYWDITTKTGERYDFTSPGTRTLDSPDCYPNRATAASTSTSGATGGGRLRPAGADREDAHHLHPLGHGHLQAAWLDD